MSTLEKVVIHRWKLFWVFILIVLGSSFGLKDAAIPDNSLQVWFLKSDPLLKDYQKFHDTFGNDEVILIALNFKEDVFAKDNLEKIKDLSAKISQIDGIDQVISLVNVQDVYDKEDEIYFEELIPETIPSKVKKLESIKARALANPLIHNRLVNTEGNITMIWAQMDPNIDLLRDSIVAEVKSTVKANTQQDKIESHFGGVGIIYSALNIATTRDFGLFILLSYIMMVLFLWYAFRSIKLIIGAMSVISVGTIFTLGLYGLFGNHLNMVTVMLPTLVAILGIADAIHFPSAFIHVEEDNPNDTKIQVATKALKTVFMPCLFTTLTTMVGFLALTSSPMAVIQQLGFYAAWGIGISLIASILFMVIAYMAIPEHIKLPNAKLIGGLLNKIEGAHLNAKKWPLITCLVITLLGGIGIPRLNIDTLTIGYLPDKDEAVVDHKQIEKIWGNYNVLEMLIYPKSPYKADSPEVLRAIESFTSEIENFKEVRYSVSLSDVYRRVERVFRGEAPPAGPMSNQTIEQLKLIVDSGVRVWDRKAPNFHENLVAPFIDQSGYIGRITFVAEMLSAKNIDKILKRTHQIADIHFKDIATVKASGYVPLYVKIIDYILSSQLQSLFIALGLIFILMLAWLKSFRLALIGVIPNIFPVFIMFGVMGHLGITLDIATATIAAIVIGVSIDDTIHFLYYWALGERKGLSYNECIRFAFKSCGRAAVTTSVLLFLGYAIMLFASVKSVASFGSLTAMAAVFALIGDLMLLPILLKIGYPKRN